MKWKIIKTEEEYNAALERMNDIFNAKEGTMESDEAELLMLLIEDYENKAYPIEEADPIAIIKMKMEYMGLENKDMSKYFGSKSTTSKVLNYKQALNLKMIRNLYQGLDIPIELMVKEYLLMA